MKKIVSLFLFSFVVRISLFADPLAVRVLSQSSHLSTNCTYYKGDHIAKNDPTWYFQFQLNQGGWSSSSDIQVGAGQNSADVTTGWTWVNAAYYNHIDNIQEVKGDVRPIQLTAEGTWYVVGRARLNASDSWVYATNEAQLDAWSTSTTIIASTCPHVFVNKLLPPTNPAFDVSTKSLTWSRFQGYSVMIVRYPGGATEVPPVDGITYADGTNLGAGFIVASSHGGSEDYTDYYSNLLTSTEYDYYFYSENYGCYSEARLLHVTTDVGVNDYFRSTRSANWSVVGGYVWESSPDGVKWIARASQSPTQNAKVRICDTHAIAMNISSQIGEITIDGGASLSIPSPLMLTTGTLIMSHNLKAPQLEVSGGSVACANYFLRYAFSDASSWYMIGFPSAVVNVTKEDGSLAVYDDDYGAYCYDVVRRAGNQSGWVEASSITFGPYAVWGNGTLLFELQSLQSCFTTSSHVAMSATSSSWPCNAGWNFVTQPLSVNAFVDLALGEKIYVYKSSPENSGTIDPEMNHSKDYYVTCDALDIATEKIVTPFEAFFVKVGTASSLPINITPENNPRNVPSMMDLDNVIERLMVHLGDTSSPVLTKIRLRNDATSDYDELYDAPYAGTMLTTSPQLYTLIGSDQMAINSLPASSTIPLGLRLPSLNTTRLSWTLADALSSFTLVDNTDGTEIDMRLNDSYTFTPAAVGTVNNRFQIVTAPGGTTGQQTSSAGRVAVISNNHTTQVLNLVVGSQLALYDALGRQLQQFTANNASTCNFTDLKQGVYLLRIRDGVKTTTHKFVVH